MATNDGLQCVQLQDLGALAIEEEAPSPGPVAATPRSVPPPPLSRQKSGIVVRQLHADHAATDALPTMMVDLPIAKDVSSEPTVVVHRGSLSEPPAEPEPELTTIALAMVAGVFFALPLVAVALWW